MVVASVALIVALGGSAYAFTNFVDSKGQIHGCVGSKGRLSVLKPGHHCATGTSPIAWSKGANFNPANFQRSHATAGGALVGTYPAPRLRRPEPWNEVGDGDGPPFSPAGNSCAFFLTGPVFTNYGQGYSTAAFYRDPLGGVHIKGLVKERSDTTCKEIFVLPPGYRPLQQEVHPAVSYDSSAGAYVLTRIDVMPTGEVVAKSAGPSWVSLDGIAFRCEPSGTGGCP
jgi:hypothetical protein